MMISLRYILRPFLLLFLSLLVFSGGCAREEGLLKNPGFKATDKSIKDWSVEGNGSLEKDPGGGARFVSAAGAPFVYQQAEAKKRHKGSSISLGAWVRTDLPDSVFIEFSNRLGIDARSEMHPGDGKWRLMMVSTRVPEASQMLEFRLRVSKAGVVFIKDASMSPGMTVPIEGGGPGLDGPVFMAILAEGAVLALILGIVVRFQRRHDTVENRIIEVFAILCCLTAMVLILGKTSNASVAANIAWATGCAGGLLFIKRVIEKSAFTRMPGLGAIISGAAVISLLVALASLRDGSVAAAGKSALLAYIIFISSFAVIPAYRLYMTAAEGKARRTKVRIFRRPDVADSNLHAERDGVSADECCAVELHGQGPNNG